MRSAPFNLRGGRTCNICKKPRTTLRTPTPSRSHPPWLSWRASGPGFVSSFFRDELSAPVLHFFSLWTEEKGGSAGSGLYHERSTEVNPLQIWNMDSGNATELGPHIDPNESVFLQSRRHEDQPPRPRGHEAGPAHARVKPSPPRARCCRCGHDQHRLVAPSSPIFGLVVYVDHVAGTRLPSPPHASLQFVQLYGLRLTGGERGRSCHTSTHCQMIINGE